MAKKSIKVLGKLAIFLGAVAISAVAGYSLLIRKVSRSIIAPPKDREIDTHILDIDYETDQITLTATQESEIPGKYGLSFDSGNGYLKLGKIVGKTGNSITRELDELVVGSPKEGQAASVMSWYYLAPSELGIAYKDIELSSELGPVPAWVFYGGQDNKWAVLVHGRGVNRSECLRGVPLLSALGYNCLVTSYRNDGTAPKSNDGNYGLGSTEWMDVQKAVDYVTKQGATQIVMMAWSMGAAITMNYLRQIAGSEQSKLIKAAVLDSPVIDWNTVLQYHADASNLPDFIRHSTLFTMGSELGRFLNGQENPINLDALSTLKHADELAHPVLILHSDDDKYVPSAASRELAAIRPDLVTLVNFDTAGHVRLWNYDPERWSTAIKTWLNEVVK